MSIGSTTSDKKLGCTFNVQWNCLCEKTFIEVKKGLRLLRRFHPKYTSIAPNDIEVHLFMFNYIE